jgi:selenocysteine lyase/cysteine desulfurase
LAGIIAFRHPRADAIAAELRAEKIHIMAHAGRLRVAIHGYNTASDIERFLDALAKRLSSSGE